LIVQLAAGALRRSCGGLRSALPTLDPASERGSGGPTGRTPQSDYYRPEREGDTPHGSLPSLLRRLRRGLLAAGFRGPVHSPAGSEADSRRAADAVAGPAVLAPGLPGRPGRPAALTALARDPACSRTAGSTRETLCLQERVRRRGEGDRAIDGLHPGRRSLGPVRRVPHADPVPAPAVVAALPKAGWSQVQMTSTDDLRTPITDAEQFDGTLFVATGK
jgi:hypothetical protein